MVAAPVRHGTGCRRVDDGEPRGPAGEGSGGSVPWYIGGGQPPAPTTPGPAPSPGPTVDVVPAPAPAFSWEQTPARPETAQQPAWPTAPDSPQSVPRVGPSGAGRFRLPLGVIVALVVALLAGGIYVVVRSTSSPEDGVSSADGGTSVDTGPTGNGSAQGGGSDPGPVVDATRVGPLQPVSVRASCQADPGVDSAGNTITYEPDLTLDAVPSTAWRCPGSAVGQQLVYDFGTPVTLTSVGLVPGYAKVDPVDGSNRFAENRTITAVTWRFDDGTSHRQAIGDPGPSMVSVDLPRAVSTSEVVLEIAGTGNDAAIRDFTPVSDVRFAGY